MTHEDLKENWSNISRDASDIMLQTLQYVLYMQILFTNDDDDDDDDDEHTVIHNIMAKFAHGVGLIGLFFSLFLH